MSDVDDLLSAELRKLPHKPSDGAEQKYKKRYSEMMSAAAARALAEALRRKGLKETLPRLGDSNITETYADAGAFDDGKHQEGSEEEGASTEGNPKE